jgi:hypothetical protein
MTLITVFSDLCEELAALYQLLDELHTTVVEDKPRRGDVVLVERLGYAADDARGLLDGALAAAKKGRQALEGQRDLETACRALATSNDHFNQLLRIFSVDIFSYDRLTGLNHAGRKRGDEWRAWAGVVGNTLDRCQQNVYHVSQALFQCWQEIAERSGMTSVSVQTRNVGQQFLVSDGGSATQRRASKSKA